MLKIKELLRRGQIIPLEESSRKVLQELETFWPTNKSASTDSNTDSEVDSDSEYNDEIAVSCANYSDIDEDFELSDSLDVTNNTIISTTHGVRLCNVVKEELSNAYFKVNINNENKFLHKQAAC